ncbi:unnamed protein product [Trichogramma brassicae]|uniref:G-protein coupled receptors family 2 profile 2 domain-containing protein n=1 Tax=Trichogramma brassicae TaxID=86971 RepID=A0A6H5HX30_9HYME|nr:unnamed protein product [Trichogramma brassicae]
MCRYTRGRVGRDRSLLILYTTSGAGAPIPISIAICAAVYDFNELTYTYYYYYFRCYIHEGNYMVVLMYPVCVSMAFNLLFLCNIVRVVVLKLRSGPSIGQSQPPRAILQAFKATFLLVPLLGLHYLVVPLRPEKGASWEKFYSVISAITASFQVIQQFKRKWEGTAFARKRANSCTATTVSVIARVESLKHLKIIQLFNNQKETIKIKNLRTVNCLLRKGYNLTV